MIDKFRFHDERDWFLSKRFGLFIHWGLYSIPAWQEQILWRGRMPRKEYEPLIKQFNPVKYDPDEWIDIMDQAGMDYLCFTSKHHDGFCMWDTKQTSYNIMNTPYGKDVTRMLADACKRRDKVMGIYYSIPDWHHPNYPNQGRHHEMFGPRKGDEPDFDKYSEFMENQVTELCSQYGKIGQLFWDINAMQYNNTAFNDKIRSLQPSMVINDRGPANGDFETPERNVPEGMEFAKLTEAVQALGRESWGYRKDEDYYNHKFLMQSIDKVLAMGGNYQLNVGPRADGTFDPKDIRALQKVGKWYKKTREAFEGTVPATTIITQTKHEMKDEILLTRRGNTIYVHLYKDIQSTAVILKPLDKLPKKATLLNNGQELEARVDYLPSLYRDHHPFLRIRDLPTNEITDEVLIIKLEFDESIND